MSGPTASVADGSRTEFKDKDDSRVRKTGYPQTQCSPVPLPALGTQKIIQGNGTSVGTVISLQCPAKHRLVGNSMKCVMETNSTQWVGRTSCQPLSFSEDYGFRVAVLASIISSGIILLLSVAFITCCLLECIKEDKKKKPEGESDALQCEQQQGGNWHSYKGRNNNNNNNVQEKMLTSWDAADPILCDNMRSCRCQQYYTHHPTACTYGPPPSLLPGLDFNQPLLPRNLDSCPPEYPGPPLSSYQTIFPGQVHIPAAGAGLMWQCGEQHSSSSELNPTIINEYNSRNMNSNRSGNTKDVSIRVISV